MRDSPGLRPQWPPPRSMQRREQTAPRGGRVGPNFIFEGLSERSRLGHASADSVRGIATATAARPSRGTRAGAGSALWGRVSAPQSDSEPHCSARRPPCQLRDQKTASARVLGSGEPRTSGPAGERCRRALWQGHTSRGLRIFWRENGPTGPPTRLHCHCKAWRWSNDARSSLATAQRTRRNQLRLAYHTRHEV